MTQRLGTTRTWCVAALMLPGVVAGWGQGSSAAGPGAGKPETMTRTQRSDAMMTAPVRTFYLRNASSANSANEILTALRLMLDPADKMYLDPQQDAILVRALPDDMALAASIVADLDKAPKNYRLDFTVTEFDGSKRLGVEHLHAETGRGQRVTLKQGLKVPIVTGRTSPAAGPAEGSGEQVQYLDVGLNVDATVTAAAGGGQLNYKVERMTLAEDVPSAKATDPVFRQAQVTGVTAVPVGRPVVLGGMDLPGGTHRLEVAVTLEEGK